jgi:uncharacterized coiled-coil protein SlyX
LEKNISPEDRSLIESMEALIANAERDIEELRAAIQTRKEEIKRKRGAIKSLLKESKASSATRTREAKAA